MTFAAPIVAIYLITRWLIKRREFSKNVLKIQGREEILILFISLIQGSFCKSLERSLKMLEKSVKIRPPKKKKLWSHQDIAYVSKYYIIMLIYSCFQLCQLDTCKIVMLTSSETFYICPCLESITTLFDILSKGEK